MRFSIPKLTYSAMLLHGHLPPQTKPLPCPSSGREGGCFLVGNTAAANHLSVPVQGVLGNALSGEIVDKHQKMFHNRIHQSNHILRKISPFRKLRKGDNCSFCRISSPEWKTPELYSTVTLLARFRGLSTSSPFATAGFYHRKLHQFMPSNTTICKGYSRFVLPIYYH